MTPALTLEDRISDIRLKAAALAKAHAEAEVFNAAVAAAQAVAAPYVAAENAARQSLEQAINALKSELDALK